MRQSTQNGHVQTEDSGRMRVDMQSEKQKYEHSTRNDQHYKDFQQIHYPLLKVNLAVGVLRKCESWRHRPQAAHSLKYLQCLAGGRGTLIERIGTIVLLAGHRLCDVMIDLPHGKSAVGLEQSFIHLDFGTVIGQQENVLP